MSAPKGNQFATKLNTEELKKLAYKQYCEHIASGKSKKSWYLKHPDLSLTFKTMEKYLKNEEEFPPIHKEIAEAEGFAKWEQIVEDSATGVDKGRSNTASLQMIMRNKFGWDKEDKKDKPEDSEKQDDALRRMLNHLDKQAQASLNIPASSVSNA